MLVFDSEEQVIEYARKALQARVLKKSFTDPAKVGEYLTTKLSSYEREVFGVLYLNNKNCVIAEEDLFFGGVDNSQVDIRELVKHALVHNAKNIILYHNHPSGIPDPSQADRHITRAIMDVLRHLDMKVLDHFVVGGGTYYSFAQHGEI